MNESDFLLNYTESNYLDKREFLFHHAKPADWERTLEYRKNKAIEIPLVDQTGNRFWFIYTEKIKEKLKFIDENGSKSILDLVASKTKNAVLFEALFDEAYYSSIIEGAFSTKKQIAYLIKNKIEPSNLSEKMILNNLHALNFILENIENPINENMLLKIFRIITENTLDLENITEKYRDGAVEVVNRYRETIYTPPEASKIQNYMDSFFQFLSMPDNIHPVLKACILHFYFVYVHPFFDGNGRTARAFAMMYIIQNQYEFFKFFTVSGMINNKKSHYYKAIKQTEDYGSDLTYFLTFMLEMYTDSILSVSKKFLDQTAFELIESILKEKGFVISDKQNKLLHHLLKSNKNSNFITIDEYKKRYKTSYEKARTDLQKLFYLGLLKKTKAGKKFIYNIISNEEIISMYRLPISSK